MNNLVLTDLFAILSSAVVLLTALAALFRKIRRNLVTNMASLIEIDNLHRDSSLYKTLNINEQLLEQISSNQEKNLEEFGKINQQCQTINKSLLRLELITNMDHRTEDAVNIYKLYEEYKEKGGNSYIDKLMKDWEDGKYPSVDRIVEYIVNKQSQK